MKRALLSLCLVVLPTAAFASGFNLPDGSQFFVIDPPIRYVNQYDGPLDLQLVSQAEVIRICSEAVGKYVEAACAWPSAAGCKIVIADSLPEDLGNAVLQHEYAHCAGWGADHPLD